MENKGVFLKEMRDLCKRYDIKIIDSNNDDYNKDIDFSMKDIMNEPYIDIISKNGKFRNDSVW